MRFDLLAAVCLLVVATSAVTAAPIQWEVSAGGNGHWYEYVPKAGLNWDHAREAAAASTWQGKQGYLATITSADENAWIAQSVLLPAMGYVRLWLGGYQDRATSDYAEPAGGWRWVTGEAWSYTNWGSYTRYLGSGQWGVVIEPSNDSLPTDPSNNEDEDWLQVVCNSSIYTNSPVAWNDTTYTAGFSGSPGGNGYLVEYGAVPEPSSVLALLCGLVGLARKLRRQRRR